MLSNDPERVENLIEVAHEIVGNDACADAELTMGSEDMADLLNVVPGAFFNLGHHGEMPLHTPGFLFDDTILPVGASILARLVERRAMSACCTRERWMRDSSAPPLALPEADDGP